MTDSAGDSDQETTVEQGHASVTQTVVNMSKTCMGTGTLALPFACKQGGIILHIFGLFGVGIWNAVMVQRLCMCYDLTIAATCTSDGKGAINLNEESLPLRSDSSSSTSTSDVSTKSYHGHGTVSEDHAHVLGVEDRQQQKKKVPPEGMTTLVKIAWYALGDVGANFLDVFMVLYLVGVLVMTVSTIIPTKTYVNATRSFLNDTIFTTGIGFIDSFLIVAIMAPLSLVPHTGRLAKASALGLFVLLATFLVITWYGFYATTSDDPFRDQETWQVLMRETSATGAPTTTTIISDQKRLDKSVWFPEDGLTGISSWFGISVFGFGVTPLAFNFRQGMAAPELLVTATWWAMLAVAGSYVVVGAGLLCLFPDIEADVLHELPTSGWIPTLTRLAMVLVILVTAPLLIVPCGELLEGKLLGLFHPQDGQRGDLQDGHHWTIRAAVRWSICVLCAAISAFIPGFVDVLSFVGCCCVAMVGFCLPPFLHLILTLQNARICYQQSQFVSLLYDLTLLLWGLLATAVSTVYTFHEISSAE